jgi:hypothetical protein
MEILPDCRLKSPKGIAFHRSSNWVPIFCANCGAEGGFVPEENMTFAFYQCQGCADKYPVPEGMYRIPDEVFWQKLNDAQMEQYGRILSGNEIAAALEDPGSMFSKLAKGR